MSDRRWLIPVGMAEETASARAAIEALRTYAPADRLVVLWSPRSAPPAPLLAADEVLQPEQFGLDADALDLARVSLPRRQVAWIGVPEALMYLTDTPGPVAVLRPEVQICGDPSPIWEGAEGELRTFVTVDHLHQSAPQHPDAASGYPPPKHLAHVLEEDRSGLISARLFVVDDRAAATRLVDAWPYDLGTPPPLEEIEVGHLVQEAITLLVLQGRAVARHLKGLLLTIAAIDARLSDEGDRLERDGEPVFAVSFDRFDPREPTVLRPGRLDVRMSDVPALAPLARRRAAMLLEHEVEHGQSRSPHLELRRYGRLPDGPVLEPWVRALIRSGRRAGKLTRSPFSEQGRAELEAYFRAPAHRGGSLGINRYLFAFWAARPELQVAYPVLDGPDAHGLIGWGHAYGEQSGLDLRLLPPNVPPPPPGGPHGADTPGVNLAGYFTSELGLGEGARQLASALSAAGEPITPIQGLVRPSTRQEAEFAPKAPAAANHDVNLLVVNGDIVPSFASDVGENFFAGRRTAALWWWECEPFPADEWLDALRWVDEIYVGTSFVRELIAPHVDVPIRQFPMPVSLVPSAPLPRSDFGIPDDVPMFFYMWDYHSSEVRKNPSGLARAFKEAFPVEGEAVLVLKCINHENLPEAHERVLLEMANRSDIILVDRFLPSNAKNRLLELCDCYVSPHRSEGFGHTPAEAMLLGKPVIATGYGGNLDYMAPDRGILLDYELVRIGEQAAPYPADGHWAEPDHDQLVDRLRWVATHPDEAKALGERARAYIETHHSPEAAGRALRAIVQQTRAAGAPPRSRLRSDARDQQKTAARRTLETVMRTVPGLAEARRKWWKLMDRAVHSRTAPSLQALQQRLDETASRVDSNSERIGSAEARVGEQVEREVRTQRTELDSLRSEFGDLHTAVTRDADIAGQLVEQLTTVEDRLNDHLDRHAAVPWTAPNSGIAERRRSGLGIVLGGDATVSSGTAYADFLATFRGSFERVLELLHPYADLVRGHGPLLDIGCGRGELLEIAESVGVDARGVDLDAELVAQAVERGRDAVVGDGIAALTDTPSGELGSVAAIHVIEHLEVDQLRRLFEEAFRVLKPGGVLLTETVNPSEPSAATTFWVDPTHRAPVFPETAIALALSVGFTTADVFAPDGTGNWPDDRQRCTRYTLVARRAEG
ncbi:MAG: methyltransferase domain-containing protein [Solirubrobacteraceae bacterium]|nr:methyltransferase domain-containing protein [Solirubrobacteraceae bacterium]